MGIKNDAGLTLPDSNKLQCLIYLALAFIWPIGIYLAIFNKNWTHCKTMNGKLSMSSVIQPFLKDFAEELALCKYLSKTIEISGAFSSEDILMEMFLTKDISKSLKMCLEKNQKEHYCDFWIWRRGFFNKIFLPDICETFFYLYVCCFTWEKSESNKKYSSTKYE